jgi:hypothetical protein
MELKKRFDQLAKSSSALEYIFRILQTLPEHTSATVFAKIRWGGDPESIAQSLRGGDLLSELQLRPETRYRFEFPWRAKMPDFLLRPWNQYLNSPLYELTLQSENYAPTSPSSTEQENPHYFMPITAAELIESRLDTVKPSNWTTVSCDDKLMRSILRSYFIHEYSWTTSFHKDDFLDDMQSGSTVFCSSLLVNATLAISSVSG